jgi:hypothetical protein
MSQVQWVCRALGPDELTLSAIARKYNTTPQAIVAGNEVEWRTEAINDWVIEAGGKLLPSGHTVFEPGNKIIVPVPRGALAPVLKPGVPGAPAPAAATASKRKFTTGQWLALGTGAGLLVLALAAESAKKRR